MKLSFIHFYPLKSFARFAAAFMIKIIIFTFCFATLFSCYSSDKEESDTTGPKITLNKKTFTKKTNEAIFIPLGAIHRIENPNRNPVKIIEAQLGSILKETDIIRYHDIYGRVSQ